MHSQQLQTFDPFLLSPMQPQSLTPHQPVLTPMKDIGLATPSERIGSSYTPSARGLSPRMVEFLSPGGIKPGAMGPLPLPEWREVDDADIIDGIPEADGEISALVASLRLYRGKG